MTPTWRALPLLAIAACTDPIKGTDTGNALRLEAGASAARRAALAWPVDTAAIVLADLRVEACDGDADRVDLEGPFAVDLLVGAELGDAALPATAHCALRFDIEPWDRGGALDGHAILLEGETQAGTPFRLESDATESFRIDDTAGALHGTPPTGTVRLELDLATWVAGLDIDGAAEGDAPVLINGDENTDLLDDFEDALEDAVALLRVDG